MAAPDQQMIVRGPVGEGVTMNMPTARISPLLKKVPEAVNAQAYTEVRPANILDTSNRLKGTWYLLNGHYQVNLFDPACTNKALLKIANWCEYHVSDHLFEEETTFDTFDEDEYEKETANLCELPCYFDYHFMVNLGGGETLKEANLTDFYNVIIAADNLGLEKLVLLGGKYICRQISNMSVEDVRRLLGIQGDLHPQEELKIRTDAAAHFTFP